MRETIRVEFNATYDHPRLGDLEVVVTAEVEPVDHGVLTGPPERCYPPSGGGIEEVISVVIDGGEYDGLAIEITHPLLVKWLASEDVQVLAAEVDDG